MSYCRIGEDSDVYVYGSEEHLNCMCYKFFIIGSYSEMINHLKEHQSNGDEVPSRAFNRLEHERELKGDIYSDYRISIIYQNADQYPIGKTDTHKSFVKIFEQMKLKFEKEELE